MRAGAPKRGRGGSAKAGKDADAPAPLHTVWLLQTAAEALDLSEEERGLMAQRGWAEPPSAQCRRYVEALQKGVADMQQAGLPIRCVILIDVGCSGPKGQAGTIYQGRSYQEGSAQAGWAHQVRLVARAV